MAHAFFSPKRYKNLKIAELILCVSSRAAISDTLAAKNTPDLRNADPAKRINHERYDPLVFWVDSIGKLSNIPFVDNQDIFFL